MDFVKYLIPLTAIVLGIGAPVIMLGFVLWYKIRRNERVHQTALLLAEKGQPVPPEIFGGGVRQPDSDLRWGTVLTMLGVALTLAFSQVGLPWAFGLIPAFMGIGYLIVWALERGKAKHT
jgi:Domain of unknown function (DUF6249)